MLSSTPDALFYPWFKSSQTCEVIALAASAGGFEALAQVLSGLPRDFTVPIIALLHRGKRPPGPDILVEFLSQRSRLRVVQARHGDKLKNATIHVLPPAQDMRLNAGSFQVCSSTSRLHPSADMLFESMAEGYGPRCIGVVLSGALMDGARVSPRSEHAAERCWCKRRKQRPCKACQKQPFGQVSSMELCTQPISRMR